MPVDRELAYESLKWFDPKLYRTYCRLRYKELSAEELEKDLESFYKLRIFMLLNDTLEQRAGSSDALGEINEKDKVTVDVSDSALFSVENFNVEKSRIVSEFKNRKIVNMFFCVKRFPSKLSFDWLPRLFDTMNYQFDLMIELTPLEFAKTVHVLDFDIRNISIDVKAIELSGNVPPQSLVESLEANKKIQKAIVLGEEKPYNLSIFGRVYCHESLENTKKTLDVLVSAINGHGFFAEKANPSSIRRIAKKTFILPTLLKEEERLVLSSYVSDVFPFGCNTFFSSDISPDGIFLGYIQPSNAPLVVEPRKLLNPMWVMLGISGSGKSTLAMAIATRGNDLGIGFLIIDVQGEYVEHVLDRGGIVLSFGYEGESKGIHTSINLLSLFGFPLPERKRQLISLFSVVFPDLSFQAVGFLRQAVDQAYAEKGMLTDDPLTWRLEPPTMTDLVQIIKKNMEKSEMAENMIWEALYRRLSEFAKGGGYAFFDGKTTLKLQDFGEKLVCINLKPLHSRYAKSLVAHTILQLTLGSFGALKEFRYLIVDEGWFLVENPSEENLLCEIVKTGRKFNAGVIFISQNLADLQGKAKTILNNAAIKVLFRVDETEIKDVASCFRLPSLLTERVTRLKRGEALIKTVDIPTWVQVFVIKEEIEAQPESVGEAKEVTALPESPVNYKDPILKAVLEKGICPISQSEFSKEKLLELKGMGVDFVTVGKMKGGNQTYAYRKKLVENPVHEATVAEVCRFLESEGISYETRKTREPDITFQINSLKIAIEVETGTHSALKIQDKIERLSKEFDRTFILVDSISKLRYSKDVLEKENARLVNRSDLAKEIKKLKEGIKSG